MTREHRGYWQENLCNPPQLLKRTRASKYLFLPFALGLSLEIAADVVVARLEDTCFWKSAPVWIVAAIASCMTVAGSAREIAPHDGPVSILTYDSQGRLFSGGWDGTVRQWDKSMIAPGPAMQVPTGRVAAIAVCAKEGFLLAASSDDWLHRFDIATGKLIGHLEPKKRTGIKSLALSEDCSQMYSGSSDETLRHLSMADGSVVTRDQWLDAGTVRFIIRSPVLPGLFALGTKTGGVMLWSPDSAKTPVLLKRRSSNRVVALAWRADGSQLAAAYADQTIALWDPNTRTLITEIQQAHQDEIKALAFAMGGTMLLSADLGGSVRAHRFGAIASSCDAQDVPASSGLLSLAVHQDGRTVVAGTLLGEIRQWHLPEHVEQLPCVWVGQSSSAEPRRGSRTGAKISPPTVK